MLPDMLAQFDNPSQMTPYMSRKQYGQLLIGVKSHEKQSSGSDRGLSGEMQDGLTKMFMVEGVADRYAKNMGDARHER